MTVKRPKGSNGNVMNPLQKSQYSWNMFFSRRSLWVLLEFLHRWTQTYQNWPGETINRTNLHLKPHDYQILCTAAAPPPPPPPPPHPLRKNWGDLSLPIFFWGEGGCRIYYINLLLRQYGISVAETQTFLLYKSLTKQTVLQRNLIKQTEKLICLSYFTRNADSMIKDFFPSFLFEMTAIRFWKSLNRWWRITLQCKLAHWCNGWNKMKG